jgi:transposase-like protein
MKNQGSVASDKSEIVAALPRACQDETAAVEFMEAQRWGSDPACPQCGVVDVYQMRDRKTGERSRRYLWRCKGCNRQFTVRIGTVFEDSRIPMKHWCYAFWAACASKKGVSALQIKRMTGLSYKSALFMMHRIRFAMADDYSAPEKLTGTVEVDETYVGGKPRYKGRNSWGRGTKKSMVMALVQRGGNVRAFPVQRVGGWNFKTAVRQHVDVSARIMTDEYSPYTGLGKEFADHQTVKHSRGEYARGDVHTNTVEGFFGLFKRGLNGTFHSVSKRHLHRYVDEFAFRYNARKMDDGARTALAIRKAEGKRLLYRQPTGA